MCCPFDSTALLPAHLRTRHVAHHLLPLPVVPGLQRSKVHSKGWRQPTTDEEIPQAAEAERGSYFYTDVVHPAGGPQRLWDCRVGIAGTAWRALSPRSTLKLWNVWEGY